MEPITLIMAALAAGASAGAIDGLKDSAKEAVQAAYAKLRGLARQKVAGNAVAVTALEQHETDPETWEAPLAKQLKQAGAADDIDLIAAAQQLMQLIDQAGAKTGKYSVTIKGSKGVQVGDGNVQVNRF